MPDILIPAVAYISVFLGMIGLIILLARSIELKNIKKHWEELKYEGVILVPFEVYDGVSDHVKHQTLLDDVGETLKRARTNLISGSKGKSELPPEERFKNGLPTGYWSEEVAESYLKKVEPLKA